MRTYEFRIGSAEAGLRLDHYLVKHLPSALSRSLVQRVIRGGCVTIGGRPVKAHQKLRCGDAVTARFAELPSPDNDTPLTPQDIPLEVAYEDHALLVVNKPVGLVIHPAPGHWDGTLVNAVLWHLGQGAGGRGQEVQPVPHAPCPTPPRAGIVHRLDKDTSGLLIVAKTAVAHTALSRQLKARTIRRRYLALAAGHVPLDRGTVDAPIGRHQTHRKVMTVRHIGGRDAVTHYRVLARLEADGEPLHVERAKRPAGRGQSSRPVLAYTLLEVSLDTGRTHQIRVHLGHLGHPVLGDTAYGPHPASYWASLGITRQLLHAYRLEFQHPGDRRPMSLTAPVPPDLARWIDTQTLEGLMP